MYGKQDGRCALIQVFELPRRTPGGSNPATGHFPHERGLSNRSIARQLSIRENAVRDRPRSSAHGRPDGRSGKPFRAEAWAGVIAH